MVTLRTLKQPATFGACDGLVIVLGLLVTLTGHPHVMLKAAAGAGLAELVGMTAGQWLSDSGSGFVPALANGAAACAACIVPALPSLMGAGPGTVITSYVLVAMVAAGISVARPEKGLLAIAQTYGVLIVAAALCAAVGSIT